MEKIVITIRRITVNSPNYPEFATRNDSQDAQFLSNALEISRRRAQNLITKLGNSAMQSNSIEVNVNYRQLGRYQAMRRRPVDLWKYWLAPNVIEYEEETEEEQREQPVELRPGIRKIP